MLYTQTVEGDEGGGESVACDWSIGINSDKGASFEVSKIQSLRTGLVGCDNLGVVRNANSIVFLCWRNNGNVCRYGVETDWANDTSDDN